MGQAKHYQMEQEDKHRIAEEVAERAGYLSKCEVHDEYYDACAVDIVDTYKVAASLVKKGDSLVAGFKNQKELTNMLQGLEGMYQDVCPYCQRAKEEMMRD